MLETLKEKLQDKLTMERVIVLIQSLIAAIAIFISIQQNAAKNIKAKEKQAKADHKQQAKLQKLQYKADYKQAKLKANSDYRQQKLNLKKHAK